MSEKLTVSHEARICADPFCPACRVGAILEFAAKMEAAVPAPEGTPERAMRDPGIILVAGLFALRAKGMNATERSSFTRSMDLIAQALEHDMHEAAAARSVESLFEMVFGMKPKKT